ncbi:FitA-like ribbon-helix-helix domain-containing protein [Jiella mangrovi]|uniref:Antitoxin FitA-like ribbon-helix-helix domain-containing protein n=1 Tax=Jiella mangrovi TaxID=2821407 RepID=A0ABS4BJ38_9HYPH|nr:hypothetical protein [Jiella mangrovi]MBP0615965.1 hypothetical protein [Jiella mangrovi]
MASLTIENLDDDVMRQLEARAAEHGRSPEEEARALISDRAPRVMPPTRPVMSDEKKVKLKRAIERIESGEGISDLGTALGEPALVGLPVRTPTEQKRVYEALSALSVEHSGEPFDQKAFTDELWSFVE